MQPLTDGPRAGYTADQITALLTASPLQVDFGVELLDASLNLVSDLTSQCSALTVHHDSTAEVSGTVDLTVDQDLVWGYARIRPYMLMSGAGLTNVRFNSGVYLLTTPTKDLSQSPPSNVVTGYDLVHLLQDNIGDTYPTAAAGDNVLTKVRAVIAAAGVTTPVLIDSTASASTFAADYTLALTSSSSPRWVDLVNGMLATINYRPIWADWNGALRSGPVIAPEDSPSEFTFKVGDPNVGTVSPGRTVAGDVYGAPNQWIFVQNGLSSAPAEGAGRYTVNNLTDGPSSQAILKRIVHAQVQFLDAVDQASLVAQGNTISAAAKRVAQTLTLPIAPLPIAWHYDVVTYSDPAYSVTDVIAQCQTWDLPFDFSDGADAGNDMTYEIEVTG